MTWRNDESGAMPSLAAGDPDGLRVQDWACSGKCQYIVPREKVERGIEDTPGYEFPVVRHRARASRTGLSVDAEGCCARGSRCQLAGGCRRRPAGRCGAGVPCCAFLFLPLDKAYPRRPAATAELAARSAAPVLVSGKTRTTTVGFRQRGRKRPVPSTGGGAVLPRSRQLRRTNRRIKQATVPKLTEQSAISVT